MRVHCLGVCLAAVIQALCGSGCREPGRPGLRDAPFQDLGDSAITGTIAAESSPNGTRFVVELPLSAILEETG